MEGTSASGVEEQENSKRIMQAEEDKDWLLLEELQFKSRVAAITTAQPRQQRFWLTPAVRFPHIADVVKLESLDMLCLKVVISGECIWEF